MEWKEGMRVRERGNGRPAAAREGHTSKQICNPTFPMAVEKGGWISGPSSNTLRWCQLRERDREQ